MELTEVDPLTPQPGDWVRIYSPLDSEDPDHEINWDEGIVRENTDAELELEDGRGFDHTMDSYWKSIYYMRK